MRYISKHMEKLPPYLFAQINKQKLEARRAGKDVIDFVFLEDLVETPVEMLNRASAVVSPRYRLPVHEKEDAIDACGALRKN